MILIGKRFCSNPLLKNSDSLETKEHLIFEICEILASVIPSRKEKLFSLTGVFSSLQIILSELSKT